jgi:RNA polymerase sigma-70 factor (ECF subfamily)
MDSSLAMDPSSSPGEPLDQRLVGAMPELRAFVRRLGGRIGGPADVEDLVQEVMARALRSRHTFDEERELGPWLRRTALRAYIDQRLSLQRAPRPLDARDAEPAAHAPDELSQRDSVEHLLARLEPNERDVLLRFHRDGASIREIAAALSTPEGTIKSLLSRARRKLARRTDPSEGSA